jgi:elongation factor G
MDTKHSVQVISITLTPKVHADQTVARALESLMTEDPAIRVTSSDSATGRVVVAGVSELHLEIVIDRLRREFNVEATIDSPTVLLKEALLNSAVGEIKHTATKDGRQEYAHVKVRVAPRKDGSGYVFENHLTGDAIPSEFLPAIERGIDDARLKGVCGGHPLEDIQVELLDGSYHAEASSESAFRIAAKQAFVEGALRARPTVVEPVMRVEVVLPRTCMELDDVTWGLTLRQGRIESREDRADVHVVVALVPFAQLFGYAGELNRDSRGRATYSIRFDHYEPLPAELDEGDRESWVGAPRRPVVPGRHDAIALPEPEEDDPDEDWLQPRS